MADIVPPVPEIAIGGSGGGDLGGSYPADMLS